MAQLTRDELKEALLSLKKTRHVSESIDNFIDSVWNLLDDGAGGGGGGGVTPLVYVALVTQSGTSDPAATVLQNTLGETLTWSRNDPGDYRINVPSPTFTVFKTIVFITNGTDAESKGGIFRWIYTDNQSLQIRTYGGTVGVLGPLDYDSTEPFSIRIEVYS